MNIPSYSETPLQPSDGNEFTIRSPCDILGDLMLTLVMELHDGRI